MSSTGFVNQGYRDMVKWQWYRDPIARSLFEHLLRIVNEDDKMELGICIKSGSVLITIHEIAYAIGFTVKQIRVAMDKLISSHDISIKSIHAKGTIITIEEWHKYQLKINDNLVDGNRRATEGQQQVIDNNNLTETEAFRRATEGQQNAEIAIQNQPKGNRRATEGQQQNTDIQEVTNVIENRRATEGQQQDQPKEPENREIPPETSKENKDQESDIKEKNTKKEKTTAYPFDMFWNLYDKKNDKQKCEALWAKLSEADRKACIEYLPAYVASTSGERKQYRRYPETFLRNRSWENELPVVYPQQQMLFPAQETPLQKALREADNY